MSLDELKRELSEKGEVYLRVKARPGAPKTEIRDMLEDGTLKIDVAAAPEKNKANLELAGFLASFFGVLKGKVIIISGQKEKLKLIKISQ
jgi:uncharacterized protein